MKALIRIFFLSMVLSTFACVKKNTCRLIEIVEGESSKSLHYENDTLISVQRSGGRIVDEIKKYRENEVNHRTYLFDVDRNLIFQKNPYYEENIEYDNDRIVHITKKRFVGNETKSLLVLQKFDFIYHDSRLRTINSDVTIDNNVGFGSDVKETLEIEYFDLTSENPYFIAHVTDFSIKRLGYSPLLAPFFLLGNGFQSNYLIKRLIITNSTEPTKIYEFEYQFDDQGNAVRLDVAGEEIRQFLYNYECK